MHHETHVFYPVWPWGKKRVNVFKESLDMLGLQEGQLVDDEQFDKLVDLDIEYLARRMKNNAAFDATLAELKTATPQDFK